MIGVGIITCNREQFFKKCLSSIPKCDKLVVVNDGKPYKDYGVETIQHKKNKGVAVTKNDALKKLKDCDYIFLIEDDIEIIRDDVFEKYIEAYQETGIEHFNFGFHGELNKQNGKPSAIIKPINGYKILLNKHLTGALSFFTKKCIDKVGYFDERFYNTVEHVDHTYRISQAGLTTPFWNFADILNSFDCIKEQAGTEESVIRGEDWHEVTVKANEMFKKKFGCYINNIPGIHGII